jgi:hypothetical protein
LESIYCNEIQSTSKENDGIGLALPKPARPVPMPQTYVKCPADHYAWQEETKQAVFLPRLN